MFKYLCVFLILTSPLMAYSFDTYFNTKSESDSKGNSYKVATKDIDGSKFKTYVEVALGSPATSCVIVAFGALTQVNWNNADLLALTIRTTSDVVSVSDLIGGSGSNFVDRKAASQDWTFIANSLIDQSYTYSSGLWRIEVQRPYQKREGSDNFDVTKPENTGFTPVAINVFSGACPVGKFDYGTLNALIGGFAINSLKPTKANNTGIALFSLISMLVALIYVQ